MDWTFLACDQALHLEESREVTQETPRKETRIRGRVVLRFASLAITGELARRQGHYNE